MFYRGDAHLSQRGKQKVLTFVYKPQDRQCSLEELEEAKEALEKVLRLILQQFLGEEIVP